jgi:acetyl-CoA C-acetyltransferase
MSRAPFLLFGARTGWKLGDHKAEDALIHDGLWCALENWHMGEAAEHIAAKFGVSRAEQDRFAAQSQRRAAEAWERGAFTKEIVPVTAGSGAKAKVVSRDEGPRPDTTAETLAKLKPAFREGGTVTAAGRLGPRRRTPRRQAAGARGRLRDERRGAEGYFHRSGAGGASSAGKSEMEDG